MSKQNIQQTIINQAPEAAVFFLKLGNDGLPIKSVELGGLSIPDISDILEVQCSLGSTGSTGSFAIRIDNSESKYFVADNIQAEITAMTQGNPRVIIDQLTGQLEKILDKLTYQSARTIWKDAPDFLNRREYNRFYGVGQPEKDRDGKVENASVDYVYQLFETQAPNSTTGALEDRLAYRKIPKEVAESSDYSKILTRDEGFGQALSLGAVKLEEVILSKEESDQIKREGRPNFSFYSEFGGQQENGRCVFSPMQLCVILLPPRFNPTDDSDALCVAFTGLVDSVSDEFDGTRNVISIIGSDITKWLRITQANVNPAWLEKGLPEGGTFKVFGNRFSGLLGWQIVQLLCVGGKDSEGNVVYGAGNFQLTKIVGNDYAHAKDYANYSSWGSNGKRWIYKYSDLANGLKSNSTRSQYAASAVKGASTDITNTTDQLFYSPRSVHLQVLPWDSAPAGTLDKNRQNLGVYKKIFGPSFGNWQNEYLDNFSVANEVARLTNYEFYADQYGDIFYHQPRYNNYHILSLPEYEVNTYILNDEDIIQHQFTESDEGVITSVYCVGQYDYYSASPQILKLTGFYEDPSLVRKYGRRMVSISHPYVTTAEDCLLFAKSFLIRANAARFTGTVTILGRSELRMHMPVFIPTRNRIYYIVGITHSFTYGGKYTTRLKLSFGRKPWEYISEVLDYNVMPNLDASVIYSTPGEVQQMRKDAEDAQKQQLDAVNNGFYIQYRKAKETNPNLTWEQYARQNNVPEVVPPPPDETNITTGGR
jgi:hypothetical protein